MKLKQIVALAIFANISLWARGIYSDEFTQYIRVQKHVKVYENIREQIPYEECENRQVRVDNRYDRINPIGTILGGVTGGIIGNKIGRHHKRRHKNAAIVGGVVLGGIVGNQIAHRKKYNNHSYETKRICHTRYEYTNTKVFTGYNNIAYYNGHKIVKFSKNKLRQIPIDVSIEY